MNETISTLSARGLSGELRHGYQLAARFSAWTLTAERGSEYSIVTIERLEPDAYWFDQYPQSLRLEVGRRQWMWREAERLSATQYRVTGDPLVE
jgi:hypothetical protein